MDAYSPPTNMQDIERMMAPARAHGCLACGEPAHAETLLMTAHPRWTHMRCMDWRGRPFWFERQLRQVRRLWRELPGQREVLVPVGTCLADLERRWPVSADEVQQASRAVAALVVTLHRGGVDRRLLRGL